MAVVVFDPAVFKVLYPQFASVNDVILIDRFGDATLICNNSNASPVQDITFRTKLLNLLTAHIATIMGDGKTGGALPVGRVSSATEGSVSATFDFNLTPGSQAWFAQTQYGALYWQATAVLRSARYFARPTLY